MTAKLFAAVFAALSQLSMGDVPLPRPDRPVNYATWLLEALKHDEGENGLLVYRNVQKLASPDKDLARLAYYPFSEWNPREQREALAWIAKNDACIGVFERATRLPHCWLSFIPLESGKVRMVESGLTGADIQHAARCLAVRARLHAQAKSVLAATNDAVMLINAGKQIQELPDLMHLAGLHIMELGYLSIVQLCHDIPDGLEYEERMRRVVRPTGAARNGYGFTVRVVFLVRYYSEAGYTGGRARDVGWGGLDRTREYQRAVCEGRNNYCGNCRAEAGTRWVVHGYWGEELREFSGPCQETGVPFPRPGLH